jgi:hypothetical protein
VSRLAIVGALSVVLLGVPAAGAKEPPTMVVCGRSLDSSMHRTCLVLDYRNELAQLLNDSRYQPFDVRARPRPAAYYTVRIHFREDPRWDWWFLYAPSRKAIRQNTPDGVTEPVGRSVYWRTVPSKVTEAFETLRKRLRPFAAPRRWR